MMCYSYTWYAALLILIVNYLLPPQGCFYAHTVQGGVPAARVPVAGSFLCVVAAKLVLVTTYLRGQEDMIISADTGHAECRWVES